MRHASRLAGLLVAGLVAGIGLGLLLARGEDAAPEGSPPRTEPARAELRAPQAEPSTPAPAPALPPRGLMHIEVGEAGLTVLANGVRRGALLRALARELDFVVVDEARRDPRIELIARDEDLESVLEMILGDAPHSLVYDHRDGGAVALQRVSLGREAGELAEAPRPTDESSPEAWAADREASRHDDVEDETDRSRRARPRLSAAELERTRLRREARRAGLRAARLEAIVSPDPQVRASAASRLDTEHPEELDALAEALLRDPSSRVRMKAARQMGFGNPNRVLPVLEQALSDGDPDVVIEVIDAIEFSQAPDGIHALEPLRTHPDPRIREAVVDAIDMLE